MSTEQPKNNPESFSQKAKAWIENMFKGQPKYENPKLQELWDSAGEVKKTIPNADKSEEFKEAKNKIESLEGLLAELEELYAEAEKKGGKWSIEGAKRRDNLKDEINAEYLTAFDKVCVFCDTYAPHAKPARNPQSFFDENKA